MVDSVAQVERAERVAREQGVRLPLCLELDMSLDVPGLHFGVWRSPLRTAEQARPVIARIQASEHVWLDGVMGYEAQIAGVGDNTPKRAPQLPDSRAEAALGAGCGAAARRTGRA